MRHALALLLLSLCASAQEDALRALLTRHGVSEALILGDGVAMLLEARPEAEPELVLLIPRLSADVLAKIAPACGEQGRGIELCSALLAASLRRGEGELFARSQLLLAARTLAHRQADAEDWSAQVPWLFNRPHAEQGLLGETVAASGGAVARAYLLQAIEQTEHELVGRMLPRLPLPAVDSVLLEPLARVIREAGYAPETRAAAAGRLAALGTAALPALVRCFSELDALPASPERDTVHAAVHRSLVQAFGADLGPTPKRWKRLAANPRGAPAPVQLMLPARTPPWLWSLLVCGAFALLTGVVMVLRPESILPFLLAPIPTVALVITWWEALTDAARVWSAGLPTVGLLVASVVVGLELGVLLLRKPWLAGRKPRPRGEAEKPTPDSELGEAVHALGRLVEEEEAAEAAAAQAEADKAAEPQEEVAEAVDELRRSLEDREGE